MIPGFGRDVTINTNCYDLYEKQLTDSFILQFPQAWHGIKSGFGEWMTSQEAEWDTISVISLGYDLDYDHL